MIMLSRLFGKKVQAGECDSKQDNEALLPSSSSSSSSSSTSVAFLEPKDDRHDRDLSIAIRTTLLCSAVYVGVGIWLLLILRGTQFVADADEFCLKHTTRYSPVVKDVKPNYHTIQYNGTFFHANIYRQPPSPEVDAAWAGLGIDYRSIVIPESEAEETGLRPDQVKVSELYGGGYPANVEGLHHLHCLNLMRKALWWNYKYYEEKKEGAFINSEYVVRYHVTHCMDILRQQLMCVTDIGVLGQVWYQPESEEKPIPFVDFNTKHRCRDFEAIRRWAEAHQVPPATEVDMDLFYEMPRVGDTIYPEIP